MKIIISIILTSFLLLSCKGEPQKTESKGDFELEFLFEKDGCNMYRFKDGSRYIYWTNCRGKTEHSYYQSTGKGGYTEHTQSITSVN